MAGCFGEGLVNGWCIVLRANYTPVTELKMREIGSPVNSLRKNRGYKMRNMRAYARKYVRTREELSCVHGKVRRKC